ncbi:MAG: AAA family ATPase [Candidatus Yanofskybacteria bacterium]|nr:AAA family ATPase [Candidatus Yanofskybacteria bacterium]
MKFDSEKIGTDKVEDEILPESSGESNIEKEIRIENNTLVLLVGLPGSGKSTFATQHFPLESIISTDRLKQEVSNNPGNMIVHRRAFDIAKRIVDSRLESGKVVVIDAQNLTEVARMPFVAKAQAKGAKIVAIFFDVDIEESIKRDVSRGKKVGEAYIKKRKSDYLLAKLTLERKEYIDSYYVIEPDDEVSIVLPEEYSETLRADREIIEAAQESERIISGVETSFKKREIKDSISRIPVKAGAVLFFEGSASAEKKKFLEDNFLSYQLIDAESIAKRLAVDLDDEATRDIMQQILYERMHNNLTTCVTYPPGFVFADYLKETVRRYEEKRDISITTPEVVVTDKDGITEHTELDDDFKTVVLGKDKLENYQIDVKRDAPDDAPLFIVGDVHGAYTAMREIASRIRRENIDKKEVDEPKRKIVFVGDMADRGPYSAETVIYITSLVRRGRAILVKGNHDENLMRGLKGEEIKSADTRKTIEDLRKHVKPESIQKIVQMLEDAPYYAEWKNLVITHASLPRIPRKDEVLEPGYQKSERHTMTHGARSGVYLGTRAEVWKLHNTVAKDPEVLVVGGHTHEKEPVTNLVTGTTILDASIELKGKLWGMYYPELELASAEEPILIRLYEIMTGGIMPEGTDLLAFVEYLELQGLVEIKKGQGIYNNLTLVTYSGQTELTNAWEEYPILRNFRGLIVDSNGNIVARPFEKTHKADSEIPLEKLNIIPNKVFEKANGSLGVVYFWDGEWRVATKFSFENEGYTKPSREMLSKMDMTVLDPDFTYLFEIILPNDSHIVEYSGKKELILLNAINKQNGSTKNWSEIVGTASALGCKTAEDMTEKFKGMTVAQIYQYAQEEGNLPNLEGLMAQYTDETGRETMVKVKTREYSDKKFVRDRLDWDKIVEAFNWNTVGVSDEKFEELLSYNLDNDFARAALEARIQWIRNEYLKILAEVYEFCFDAMAEAELSYGRAKKESGEEKAIQMAMGTVSQRLDGKIKENSRHTFNTADKSSLMSLMGFVRHTLFQNGELKAGMGQYALKKIAGKIGEEKKKRGKNSFWVVPT